jgi:hypothetical protein
MRGNGPSEVFWENAASLPSAFQISFLQADRPLNSERTPPVSMVLAPANVCHPVHQNHSAAGAPRAHGNRGSFQRLPSVQAMGRSPASSEMQA